MRTKKELFIAELEADRFYAIQKFDRYQTMRKLKRAARFVYVSLILIFGIICFLSTFVKSGDLNLFSGF